MKKLLTLLSFLFVLSVSHTQAQHKAAYQFFFLHKTNGTVPVNFAPVGSNLTVSVSTGVYTTGATYTDNESDVRASAIPVAYDLVLVGGAFTGSPQKLTYTYFNASGITESGSTYRWFVADDINGTNASVVSTSTTYNPSTAGKFLDVGITPRSSLSEVGTETRLGYKLINVGFTPAALLPVIYADPASGTAIAVNTYWQNNGSLGTNLTKDGSIATPTFNVTENALEFTAVTIQDLILPNPTYNKPFVIWMRVKMKTISVQTWLGFNGSHHVRYNSGVTISGVTVSGTTMVTGHWYVMCIEIGASASSCKLQIDESAEVTGINGSTNGISAGTGRAGSQSVGGSQYFNGYFSHLIIVNGAVSDSDKGLMKTWFANNAPHD